MAAEVRHLRGPKLLLVFWQGLDADLFFQGDMGMHPATGDAYVVGGQRYGPLMTHFTAPLRAIGDSAMTVFVNATAPEGVGSDADGPIRPIARTAGGAGRQVGGAPPRGDNPRPSPLHLCFHALFVVTFVLVLVLRFGNA